MNSQARLRVGGQPTDEAELAADIGAFTAIREKIFARTARTWTDLENSASRNARLRKNFTIQPSQIEKAFAGSSLETRFRK